MPEYLAPGVFVEEVSFRSKSIEGVSTTTTGFVGPTRYGPTDDQPEILTSLQDYERIYGDRAPLAFATDDPATQAQDDLDKLSVGAAINDMWHAVSAFFDNGGARLYVKRVYRPLLVGKAPAAGAADARTAYAGSASATVGAIEAGAAKDPGITIAARYPGIAGARRVRITLDASQNRLLARMDGAGNKAYGLAGVADRDVLLLRQGAAANDAKFMFALARRTLGPHGEDVWKLTSGIDGDAGFDLGGQDLNALDAAGAAFVVTATVTDLPGTAIDGPAWSGQPLDPAHARDRAPDGLFATFSPDPGRASDRHDVPITIALADKPDDVPKVSGLTVLARLLRAANGMVDPTGKAPDAAAKAGNGWLAAALRDPGTSPAERSFTVELKGGVDGHQPLASDYKGTADPDSAAKTGLMSFEDLEDISIVAAPGAMRGYETNAPAGDAINQELIGHCERMRYRIAVMDSGDGQTITQVRRMRARMDSTHAALYYPWVTVIDPVTQQEAQMPPSGFVAGIYARNDRLRAVYKAPANEVVTGAIRFETMLNRSQQEVLNPEGINCFRYFEGRGNRLWGARTISSDPEWKYVNLRRYFAYLERSIDVGTQWAVFEPNGESLWGNIRRTIEDFLFNEFQMGALLGDKPEKAYFVKCDRTTMTQNDLDNGRLVCLIGVAALRPAEFVIFRIGQWTADRKV
jgi:Bacteriophage tail sheath protein